MAIPIAITEFFFGTNNYTAVYVRFTYFLYTFILQDDENKYQRVLYI